MKKLLFSASFVLLVAATAVSVVVPSAPVFASSIKYIINDIPVTTGDIQHRAAFLRLQRRKGNAEEEMVEQALKLAEARRIGVRISDKQVNDAYARFASSNKMQLQQLDSVMAQSGVTKEHFKEFIRTQMAWNQALSARSRSEQGGTSQQDLVRRMLDKDGNKPTATEYMLQQVIFVVPASERGAILGKRKREAEAMRARYNGCATSREFAKGLIDVTVRDLGRVLTPELPSEWADQIKKTRVGGATGVRETERGVEFIGICSSREVSDDKVAKMMFESEGQSGGSEELSKKYLAEIRAKARIVKR